MENTQKIDCNVFDCAHNCVDDCSCRLDRIQVCPCTSKGTKNYDDETACSKYMYIGDLNMQEKSNSKQI